MTKRQLQTITHITGLVVFAVVFVWLDVVAGYNAGILDQWIVVGYSLLASGVVWFGLACFFTRSRI